MPWPKLKTYADLEPFVPEEFKGRVKAYVEEANELVKEFLQTEESVLPDTLSPETVLGVKGNYNAAFRTAIDRVVIQHLANGAEYPELGVILKLSSQSGIHNRIGLIRRRYGAKNNAHLVAMALRSGFIK